MRQHFSSVYYQHLLVVWKLAELLLNIISGPSYSPPQRYWSVNQLEKIFPLSDLHIRKIILVSMLRGLRLFYSKVFYPDGYRHGPGGQVKR